MPAADLVLIKGWPDNGAFSFTMHSHERIIGAVACPEASEGHRWQPKSEMGFIRRPNRSAART
jgi:hypothetical protein